MAPPIVAPAQNPIVAAVDDVTAHARRRLAHVMAKARIPASLNEGPQPVPGASAMRGRGPVGESSLAMLKDSKLVDFPNYISRQPAVYSALRTRVRSVASKEFSVDAHDSDNPADVELALLVERELELVGSDRSAVLHVTFQQVREKLLEQMVFYGSAFAGVRWDGPHIVEIDELPRSVMEFYQGDARSTRPEDRRSGWRWYNRYSSQAVWLEPGQAIVAVQGASRFNPWGVGVIDALYWLSFFEGVVLPMWAKWLERHAAPWVIAKTGSEANFAVLDELLDACFDNPNLRLPLDTTVDFIQPGSATQAIFQGFLDWANSARREVILGSQLTTAAPQPHGSYALANIHQDSTEQILQGDAARLDEALTWSVSLWLAQLYRTPGVTLLRDGRAAPPRIVTSIEKQKDINVLATQLATANRYVPIPEALVYELLPDIRQPSEGEPVIMPASAAPPGGGDLGALLGGGAPEGFGELRDAADAEFEQVQGLLSAAGRRVAGGKKNFWPRRGRTFARPAGRP